MKKKDILRKLSSRKLWMSIASFVSMLMIYFGWAEDRASKLGALIMAGASVLAYVIAEGLADSSPNTIPEDEEIEYIEEGDPEEETE